MINNTEKLRAFLELKNCPHCDYSLTSLPQMGICPECGAHYDQSFVVLTGAGMGRTATGEITLKRIVSAVAGIALVIVLISRRVQALNHPFIVVWGTMAAVSMGTSLYAMVFSPQAPRCQVWLSPKEIVQVLSTAQGRKAQWWEFTGRLLYWPLIFVALLAMLPLEYKFYAVIPLVISTAVVVIVTRRRLRRRGDLDSPDFRPGLWPWWRLNRLKLITVKNDRVRIKCWVLRRWRWITIAEDKIVDVTVTCPAELVEEFKELILRWEKDKTFPKQPSMN